MVIAFSHKPQQHGGPGSFQIRFENNLRNKGWRIVYPEDKVKPDAILVVGGTKKVGWLLRNKLRGVPIIQRIDGMNWLHRKTSVSKKKWLLDESRNCLFQVIRSFLASHVIYQSRFVLEWWRHKGWPTSSGSSVIHNGVDLNKFNISEKSMKPISLLCVEGNLDYSPYAVDLLNKLQEELVMNSGFYSIILYGGFQNKTNKEKLNPSIDYRGVVPREELPSVYQSAIYLSLDVNAACPNTVIEALASGIPVIGYDTGALKELVSDKAGKIVSYGSDPWELNFPDVENLCEAALTVKDQWEMYSVNARKVAEEKFDIRDVVEKYVGILEDEISG